MGMELVQGRNFMTERPADSATVILNEEAVARIFKTTDASSVLGKTLYIVNTQNTSITTPVTVIGVVKNFHYQSLRNTIRSVVLLNTYDARAMAVRFSAISATQIVQQAEAVWKRIAPNQPFQYSFLDENFARMYRSEEQVGALLGVFTGLSILVACLGLFGLVSFTAEQRTKEIGIRKVLGASVSSIIALLSKDFLRLVLIAISIAIPTGWYVSSRWLQDFAYRAELSWWVFGLAGLLAVAIALLTVAGQSFRAARTNPIESLRSE